MATSKINRPISGSESSYNPSDWLKNKSAHVTDDKVVRYGNVICISFILTSGASNGEVLFEFNDESIMPKANSSFYIYPLYGNNGTIFPNGSVWLWRNEQVAKYYAPSALTANLYCSMIYIV